MTIELTEEQIASILVRETAVAVKPRVAIKDPTDIVKDIKHLGMLETEHFVIVTLSTRNHIIGKHVLSIGTIDAALVHPRETFRMAIQDNAAKIIAVHNHPSGDPEPSEDDMLITKRLIAAGKIIGIQLIDHIIIAGEGFESMQQRNMMR